MFLTRYITPQQKAKAKNGVSQKGEDDMKGMPEALQDGANGTISLGRA